MEKPSIPRNEVQRLESLYNLNILDTESEERFDRITRVAKRLFDVPIALISLIDSDRQWFKSKQGLEASETSRDVSFCGHAICLGDSPLVVEDTLQDSRFTDNPLVQCDPKIRFYAGCPIKCPKGFRLGTLCIIDTKPRQLSNEDIQSLKDLALMVEDEFAHILLATTDELTRISNRRGFMQLGQHTLRLCNRLGKPVTLFMIDLNKLKQINDSYGHEAGDQALIAFSQVMLKTFRESDVIARLGGDEFALLTSNVNTARAQIVMQRLETAINLHNSESGQPYHLSYSIGEAYLKPNERHWHLGDLISQADKKMYLHKQQQQSPREFDSA